MMTKIHSYTASQKLQDAPGGKALRDGRAAAENIVPTTTGASIAAAKAFPVLKDKFGAFEVRVPTPVVSLADFAIVTKRAVTVEEVNEAFKKAAKDPYYQGILDVSDEELVSTDFIGNSHSAIVDLPLTNVVGGNLLKVVSWYDNEWGYSNRLVELTADTAKNLHEGTDKVIPDSAPVTPKEEMLPAPTTEDFLPPPVGQETNAPVHEADDTHQPVEGTPGQETPADTLLEHQSPGLEPEDPIAGPERPHNF
jgi:hypothetical protein